MKITPSGMISTITQTSGGTTIQNSYGGLQLHRKAYQKRKKTVNQQTVRSAFTSVQSSWGGLTPTQQGTWNAAADPGTSGFQLYSSINNTLINTGIDPITEYVTPVSPPTNDAEQGAETFNFLTHPYFYQLEIISPGNLFPTSGWSVYIRWTGWILSSQYRYPAANLTIPPAAISPIDAGSIFFQLDENMSNTFRNFRLGCKAQFIVGIINQTTGQIFNYLTVDATST